jgi:hypothetical protein
MAVVKDCLVYDYEPSEAKANVQTNMAIAKGLVLAKASYIAPPVRCFELQVDIDRRPLPERRN